MIIVPNGKKCYCGKRGCLDSYCSARTLKRGGEETLEQFFDDLKKGVPENKRIWDTYLEYLALAVANLRMAYDCDIILGGNIGGNMEGHMHMFKKNCANIIILIMMPPTYVWAGIRGNVPLSGPQGLCRTDILKR